MPAPKKAVAQGKPAAKTEERPADAHDQTIGTHPRDAGRSLRRDRQRQKACGASPAHPPSRPTRSAGSLPRGTVISPANIFKLVPGKKIVEEWRTNDWPADYSPSLIELSFERANPATRLTMVHSQVPAAQAPKYRQGWKDYYWTPLKRYFGAQREASGKSPGKSPTAK